MKRMLFYQVMCMGLAVENWFLGRPGFDTWMAAAIVIGAIGGAVADR